MASLRTQGEGASVSVVEGSVWMEPLHRAQCVQIGEQNCSSNLEVIANHCIKLYAEGRL